LKELGNNKVIINKKNCKRISLITLDIKFLGNESNLGRSAYLENM